MSEYVRRYPVERIFLDWHYRLPKRVCAIDLDLIEYCNDCRETLALFEYTMANGQPKATTVLRKLAARAGVPAFLVRWWRDDLTFGIGELELQRVEPEHPTVVRLALKEYGDWLTRLHDSHQCSGRLFG